MAERRATGIPQMSLTGHCITLEIFKAAYFKDYRAQQTKPATIHRVS